MKHIIKNLRSICFFYLVFTGNISLFGQINVGTFGKVSIASPNAAALQKYGEIPVNFHTGIPNISIPIYTLKQGSIQVPIQLSYHASGIKVSENSSWVGTGWSLIAGGAITRTVKDKPDEKQVESMQQLYGHFSDYGISSYILNSDANTDVSIDKEPDIFSFNFNGYSGKFVFDDSRKPLLIPEQDFKIEYKYSGGLWNNAPGIGSALGKNIESFIITVPDGTRYFFGIPPTNETGIYCDPIEVVSTYTSSNGLNMGKVISSWYLYRVVSSNGTDEITFKYKRDKYAFFTYPSYIYANQSSNTTPYTPVKNLMAGVVLSKISSKSESIDFIPGNTREDLSRWLHPSDESISDNVNTSSPTLGAIKIFNANNVCFKNFNFSFDYFVDNNTPALSYFNWIFTDKKRLKLISLQESNGDQSLSLPPYQFNYHDELVPRKLSFGLDHWGYINGANSNSMLFPEIFNNSGSMNASLGISINNRHSSWPSMRAGTLNQIVYPTGGTTDFEFEPNKALINSIETIVGGLRIKSITDNDGITNVPIKTNYSYNTSADITSGVLFSKPTYIQLLRNDWFKKTNLMGNNGNGCVAPFSDNSVQIREFLLSDNTIRPLDNTQGYHIGYSAVKVRKIGNGHSIYVYNVTMPYQINWSSGVANTYINNPGTCDLSIPNYPAVPLLNNFYRGELSTESHFNESGILLSQKDYSVTYLPNVKTVPGRIDGLILSGNLNQLRMYSYYAINSAKKSVTSVVEKTFQENGTYLQSSKQILYESPFHNQPTKIIANTSRGVDLITKNTYAFDIRSPQFDNLPLCDNASADFLSFMDGIYINMYYSAFFNCNGGLTSSCYNSILNNFQNSVFNARKNLINCTKTNYTNLSPLNLFQQNHDFVKLNADDSFKPVLWLQDIYNNALIESSVWKNNRLIDATQILYKNERNDSLGNYAVKVKNIPMAEPSLQFSPVMLNQSGNGLNFDNRYKDIMSLNYLKGNVVNQLSKDGVNIGYEYNDDNQPTVKIVNAYNMVKEYSETSTVQKDHLFSLGSSFSSSGSVQTSFVQITNGPIKFSLGNLPPNVNVTAIYTLTKEGQNPIQYYLCNAGFSGPTCNNTPSSIVLNNMAAGAYSLQINVSTSFQSFQFSFSAKYEYIGSRILTTGPKEFFYQGFENSNLSNPGLSFTGNKSFNGSYILPFVPPNNREYIIQWWNYANYKWNLNEMPFSNQAVLTGIIDEIRVYPKDAQMTTYTYESNIGLTSQCDINNKVTYYEYDSFGRLKRIRDKDRNIIKTYDYKFQQLIY